MKNAVLIGGLSGVGKGIAKVLTESVSLLIPSSVEGSLAENSAQMLRDNFQEDILVSFTAPS